MGDMRGALGPWAALAAVGWLVACAAPAASPVADAGVGPDASDADTAAEALPCPTGEARVEDGACAAVGPSSCATLTGAALQACVPRWCSRWIDDAAAPCKLGDDDCRLEATACNAPGAVSCAAGEVPAATGGCRAAGSSVGPEGSWPSPRWCADGPDAAPRDCGPGEMGCPVGEAPDPIAPGTCRPLRGPERPCPDGFDPVHTPAADALPACAPSPTDCGAAPYAVAPGPGVVFVDAAAPAGGDGSHEAPFQKLAEALEAVTSGGTIAITDGLYAGGIFLTKPVKLIGRCAKTVRLQGVVGKPNVEMKGKAAGSVLRGLQLEGGTRGIQAEGAADLVFERVRVTGAISRGISLTYGTQAVLNDCLIDDVLPDAKQQHAEGIFVDILGNVTLARVRVRGTHGDAIVIRVSSTLDAVDLLVDATNPNGVPALGGAGLRAEPGATVKLRRVAFVGTREFGLFASSKSTLTAERLLIDGVRPTLSDTSYSEGAFIGTGTVADLRAVRITGIEGVAIRSDNKESSLKLQFASIYGIRTLNSGDVLLPGVGVYVRAGASADIRRSMVVDSVGFGIWVEDDGSALSLDWVIIRDIRHANKVLQSEAILAVGCVSVTVRRTQIEDVAESGLYVQIGDSCPPTSRVVLTEVDVRRVYDPMPGLPFAIGVDLQSAPGRVQGLRVRDCEGGGIRLGGEAKGEVELADVRVEGGRPDASGDFGLGLAVVSGVRVALAGVHALSNRSVGLVMAHPGTQVVADGVRIDMTSARKSDGGGGHGVYAALQSELTLRNSVVAENLATGIAVDNAKAVVTDCVIRNTRLGPLVRTDLGLGAVLADGLVAVGQSAVEVRRSLVLESERAGVLVDAAVGVLLQATLLRGGIYGLAKQGGGTWLREDCAIVGASLASTASDQGLAVPKAPVAGF